jgi:beta-glucosidase-like glycosyl hydrolase
VRACVRVRAHVRAHTDRGLYRVIGNTVGTEARALNNQGGIAGLLLFTPNINMVRDPRWGRNQEVPSESPAHTAAYVSEFSSGVQQGNDPR